MRCRLLDRTQKDIVPSGAVLNVTFPEQAGEAGSGGLFLARLRLGHPEL